MVRSGIDFACWSDQGSGFPTGLRKNLSAGPVKGGVATRSRPSSPFVARRFVEFRKSSRPNIRKHHHWNAFAQLPPAERPGTEGACNRFAWQSAKAKVARVRLLGNPLVLFAMIL